MLYDNGGLAAPRPMPTGGMGSVPYTPRPRAPMPPPVGYAPGMGYGSRAARERYKKLKQRMPGGYGARRLPAPPPTPMPLQPSGMNFLGNGQGGGGQFSPPPMNARDHLGNVPGDWDYQKPQQLQQQPRFHAGGSQFQFGPPQYSRNPYMPAIPY